MDPTNITEFIKQLGPWVDMLSEITIFILNDIVLKLLGVALIIARLTPTNRDNKIISSIHKAVYGAVYNKNEDL